MHLSATYALPLAYNYVYWLPYCRFLYILPFKQVFHLSIDQFNSKHFPPHEVSSSNVLCDILYGLSLFHFTSGISIPHKQIVLFHIVLEYRLVVNLCRYYRFNRMLVDMTSRITSPQSRRIETSPVSGYVGISTAFEACVSVSTFCGSSGSGKCNRDAPRP